MASYLQFTVTMKGELLNIIYLVIYFLIVVVIIITLIRINKKSH